MKEGSSVAYIYNKNIFILGQNLFSRYNSQQGTLRLIKIQDKICEDGGMMEMYYLIRHTGDSERCRRELDVHHR